MTRARTTSKSDFRILWTFQNSNDDNYPAKTGSLSDVNKEVEL